jgi:probable rRNA maturation factor
VADRHRTLYVAPLRIDVTVRASVPVVVSLTHLARAIRDAALAAAAPLPASVGLVLSDDDELASLNMAHMGKSGPTDVLSFPMLPPDAFGRGDESGARGRARTAGYASPPGARTALGDIAISVERAIAQAREGLGGQDCRTRWGARDELLLLAVHGTLHLCGFDHATPDEDREMRALERTVLAAS